jgi:hypothetical protein
MIVRKFAVERAISYDSNGNGRIFGLYLFWDFHSEKRCAAGTVRCVGK